MCHALCTRRAFIPTEQNDSNMHSESYEAEGGLVDSPRGISFEESDLEVPGNDPSSISPFQQLCMTFVRQFD